MIAPKKVRKATGNKKHEAEGDAQKLESNAQDVQGRVKGALRSKLESGGGVLNGALAN